MFSMSVRCSHMSKKFACLLGIVLSVMASPVSACSRVLYRGPDGAVVVGRVRLAIRLYIFGRNSPHGRPTSRGSTLPAGGARTYAPGRSGGGLSSRASGTQPQNRRRPRRRLPASARDDPGGERDCPRGSCLDRTGASAQARELRPLYPGLSLCLPKQRIAPTLENRAGVTCNRLLQRVEQATRRWVRPSFCAISAA